MYLNCIKIITVGRREIGTGLHYSSEEDGGGG